MAAAIQRSRRRQRHADGRAQPHQRAAEAHGDDHVRPPLGGEVARPEEQAQVLGPEAHRRRQPDVGAQAAQVGRGRGAHGVAQRQVAEVEEHPQHHGERRHQREVAHQHPPRGDALRARAQGVQQQQQRGQRHRALLGPQRHQVERRESRDAQRRRGPVGQVEEAGQEHEDRRQDLRAAHQPRHRLHVHGVHGEHQPGARRRPHPAAQPQHQADHQHRGHGVQQRVHRVHPRRRAPGELPVEREGEDGYRAVELHRVGPVRAQQQLVEVVPEVVHRGVAEDDVLVVDGVAVPQRVGVHGARQRRRQHGGDQRRVAAEERWRGGSEVHGRSAGDRMTSGTAETCRRS